MSNKRVGLAAMQAAETRKQDKSVRNWQKNTYNKNLYHTNEDYRKSVIAISARWTRANLRRERDIGDFPLEIDWDRRLACKTSLQLFDETYLGLWKTPDDVYSWQIPLTARPKTLPAGCQDPRGVSPTPKEGIFDQPWSNDQLVCVAKAETLIREGGKFAVAMPRAGGKTANIRGATLWAAVYNFRRFIFNIGSKELMALATLRMVKNALENNPKVRQDFPELCWAIFCLEGSNHLSKRQTYLGEKTHVNWGDDDLRFPYLILPQKTAEHFLEHDESSVKHVPHLDRWINANGGIILRSAGIDGAIRGEAESDPIWGTQPRPDLVILDDVQKDQKADSPLLCEKLIRLIDGAVTGLAGGGKHIDILMPCTVIREGDAADTYLDPLKKPDFQGIRCRMVESWPDGITDYEITNDTPAGKHWNKYAELRRVSLRDKGNISEATAYYVTHRKVMDTSFTVSWIDRWDRRSEVSAQQHAMNLRLQLGPLFLSEYQNIGRRLIETVDLLITADQLSVKVIDIAHCQLAPAHQYVVNFIDVQDEILFYLTFGCDTDMNGTFVDYGTWPDTKHSYFTKAQTASWGMITSLFYQVPEHAKYKSKAIRTSSGRIRAPLEAKIYWALNQCTTMLLNREYERQDTSKARMKIRLMGIDTRWGQASEAIKRFIRESGNQAIIPCFGAPFPPTNRQLEEYEHREGWFFENMQHPMVREPAWVLRPNQGDGMIYMQMDVNRLKDRLFARLATPLGAPGCVTLHTAPKEYHELFSHHVCSSEYPEPVTARNITKNMFVAREGSAYDNDWLDCAAGCLALASACGASLKTTDMTHYQPVHRKLSSLHAQKRAAEGSPHSRMRLSKRHP